MTAMTERRPYSLAQLTLYFLKLGSIGFGGPVALVGYMYRDLVENRHWIGDEDYKEGLTLAQLMPGPLAAQLAMYLGYVHYRIAGATVAGIAFVLPSFLMVVAIGWAYVRYGGLPGMQAAFYGVIDVLRGRTMFFIRRYHALALIHQALAHWGLGGEMPEHLCRQIVEVTHAQQGPQVVGTDRQRVGPLGGRAVLDRDSSGLL